MSLTLGEKLRQAREERGIPLSEVAEQTRISSLYLQSIENDDYKILPGGIFNKGFIKSYAKYVGIDEQEALMDYSRLLAQAEMAEPDEYKPYKPEVLTDDRPGSSMIPTIIFAIVILALMSAGILFGVNYLRNQPEAPVANKQGANTNANSASPANVTNTETNVPDMATLKVEFKALGSAVSLSSTIDGKPSTSIVNAGSAATFEPKESLKLSYSRSLAQAVQMTINGKPISLPATPLNPKRSVIEFEINKQNIGQIWQAGAISTEVPTANPDANAITTGTSTSGPVQTKPAPKPTVAANAAPTGTPASKPPTPKPTPVLKPTVITTKTPRADN